MKKPQSDVQELENIYSASEQNEIILEAVASNGQQISGRRDQLEEAAKGAIQQVNLYLSE